MNEYLLIIIGFVLIVIDSLVMKAKIKSLNDKSALCMGIVCLSVLEQNDDGKELLKKFGISIEGANEEND
jgi:hypothetical protein